MTDTASEGIRRYLLGAATDEEAAAIEADYFRSEPVLDRVDAIEEELVEDYLAGELSPRDRERFERVYLASPVHRRRVEVIRRLSATSVDRAAPAPRRTATPTWRAALALAATLLLAVGGVWWVRSAANRREATASQERRPAPAVAIGSPERPPQPPGPVERRVVAVTLSPITLRGAADAPAVVVPAGTDAVTLDLESDGTAAVSPSGRAVISTAAGDVVWQGSTGAPPQGAKPSVAARIEVPASLLHADDYVITLFVRSAGGADTERARYVLRVRGR